MSITLRIVGIFFRAEIDVDLNSSGDARVIEVLNAAGNAARQGKIPNISDFRFETSNSPKQSLISFYVNHTNEFNSLNGFNITYDAGEYFLAEDLNARPAYNVWQYYVSNAEGIPITGVRFLDDPLAVVPDGGFLTWRLVSVLAKDNPPSPLDRSRLGLPPK